MKITEREYWFLKRVGKVIYRTKCSCKCATCTNIYHAGLFISDIDHAEYVYQCEGEMGLKYFDTIEERNELENCPIKTIPPFDGFDSKRYTDSGRKTYEKTGKLKDKNGK